jgi:hypothetical protein
MRDRSRLRGRVETQGMSARQGKIAVAATVLILSGLLLRQAIAGGGWPGFWVTEVQLLVPMAISWWVLTKR